MPSNLYTAMVSLPNHVDKSEMLRYFFDPSVINHTDVPYYFINTPRGFGKSFNLDMVNLFASYEYNSDGFPKQPRHTKAYKVFQKLKISKYESVVSEHLARYPVISLDLTGVGSLVTTTEQTIQDLNFLLKFEMDNYSARLNSINSTSNPYNITDNEIIFMNKLREKKLDIELIVNGGYTLTKILYKVFNGTKIVLLIDEYGYTAFKSPATLNSYAQSVCYVMNDMIAQTLIMARPYTKVAIITGISTLSFPLDRVMSLTTRPYAFLDDHEFTPYYGITEPELDILFDKYKCSDPERQTVRAHYKGYKTCTNQRTIYNTQSIFHYFQKRGFKPPKCFPIESFWRKADTPGCIAPYIRHPEFRTKFHLLLDNKTIELSFEKMHTTKALKNLEDLRDRNFTRIDDASYLDTFFTDMFELGYLSHGPDANSYLVPNKEVREILQQELRIYTERYEGTETEAETTTSRIIIPS